MSDGRRGLPLLSGPPPTNLPESDSCRKCGKEFNVIFTRSRKCNHCAYLYCHSCSDYQALMPRLSNGTSGYDVSHVCGFCIEFLTITASGKTQLKSMPLGKLKKYANAYNIRISHAVEKDDVIEALLAARGRNGCLSAESENYYRMHSVPSTEQRPGLRNFFRSQPSTSAPPPPQPPPRETRPPAFPRPDLEPDPHLRQQQHAQMPQPSSYPNAQPRPGQGPQPSQQWSQYQAGQQPYHQPGYNPSYNPHYQPYNPRQPPPTPPQASRPPPSQPRQAPPPPPRPQPSPPRPQPPPVPSLDELLNMDAEAIGRLSISSLKSVLFTNHVAAGQVLEKAELVRKVVTLVDDERRERERQRQLQELEEMERLQREQERRDEADRRAREQTEQQRRERAQRAQQRIEEEEDPDRPGGTSQPANSTSETNPIIINSDGSEGHSESAVPPTSPPKPSAPSPPPPPRPVERSGLCVVCQDEEANIAIVDCGHLCMCRGCSELIMSSSRECPLCRTRIVTEARLLRIFKS